MGAMRGMEAGRDSGWPDGGGMGGVGVLLAVEAKVNGCRLTCTLEELEKCVFMALLILRTGVWPVR